MVEFLSAAHTYPDGHFCPNTRHPGAASPFGCHLTYLSFFLVYIYVFLQFIKM